MSGHTLGTAMPRIVNSGARLDRLPISRFHWRVLWLISAGAILDAFDIYLAGGVTAAMLHDGFSTLKQNAAFVSATFFGMLIGAGLAGWVGDHMGRRYSYQTNLALFGVASIAAVFAPNIETLIGLRWLMGVGLGAELVVAAGTLCEFIPPTYRGRWISMMGLVINSGLLFATFTGYFVIPHFGWRVMFAIAGVGAMIVWHVPVLFNAALASEGIHILQHLSFLVTGVIFWWPVLTPADDRSMAPLATISYLFGACLTCSLLGAALTFAHPGLYPAYLNPEDNLGILPLLRNQWGLDPKHDQQLGGLLMWVPGCFVYLTAILATVARWYEEEPKCLTV